ncbi:hypothetical protein [Bdellovibrio sp. KM01]|uniref:hypothetical protein n=1 Tax=Bdellovibrio sp. KM01 TaxID=2748865 RepID=UPI0015E999EE|nr:hypothetical protein [Bdellovibrio sp. KM01]QLY23859.1 hypothetical protein HW988_10165 [Bdellovibrio sp. KM01]
MENAVESFKANALKLSEVLRERGIDTPALSPSSPFVRVSHEIQTKAIERTLNQIKQMEIVPVRLEEFEKLRMICRFHGVKPVSTEVYERLTNDMAWEILDFGLNQLYRNETIFKLGNYSIEDYESYTPAELFSRPMSVLKPLVEKTLEVKASTKVVDLSSIPSYVIEETQTRLKSQFRITHSFACALKSISTNENTMFVFASYIEPIDPSRRVAIM